MAQRFVTTRSGRKIPVSGDPVYMNDPASCVDFIIKQMPIYDKYLGDRTDMVILDIGANIGLTALAFVDSASRIVSVEAAPKQILLFKEHCAGEPKIELVEAALSNVNGETTFYINENTTNSLYEHEGFKHAVTVKTFSLKGVLDAYNLEKVDFCKMDIEGSEMVAVTVDTLSEVFDRIDVIFMEIHANEQPWKTQLVKNLNIIRDVAHKVGYKTREVDWEDPQTPTTLLLYK